ncbi:MAG: 4Fe-4S dicluster domain-containing protein [Desulfobacterales bacterium]
MSEGKSILVDTSRCTACRGCQVACKQWNELPGTRTRNVGSYQNPQDLSADTWKLVRFSEGKRENGKPFWYFFSDQCRHCMDAPCLQTAGYPEAVYQDKATGAVIYTDRTKELDIEAVISSCPYNIPRKSEKTGGLFKCTMCIDRITSGEQPACVKSCPTGAMVFGDRQEILERVKKRVEELKNAYPKAQAIDADTVRVIYIVTDDPAKYYQHAAS